MRLLVDCLNQLKTFQCISCIPPKETVIFLNYKLLWVGLCLLFLWRNGDSWVLLFYLRRGEGVAVLGFVAVCRISVVAVGRGYSLVKVLGLLMVVASFLAEHGLL